MKDKILQLCLSPNLGGLELYMKDLTTHLKCRAVIGKKTRIEEYFKKDGIFFDKIGRKDFLSLAKIIDKYGIKLIHFHHTKDLPVAVLAKKISKSKPLIVQSRHMHMTRLKNDFYHKYLYKNIDTMIAVTKKVHEQLNIYIDKSVRPSIIHSYIGVKNPQIINKEKKDALKEKYAIKDEFIVCIVGRIEQNKGQHKVLKAVLNLRNKGENIKTLVVGDAMDEEYLKRLKSQYPQDIFTGFVNNADELMQLASCLVLATTNETFGLVLVEGMRSKICVLATNKGGPLEIIEDERSGLLYDDMVEGDLENKIMSILKNNSYRENLAKEGKKRADKMFDSNTQFNHIEDILLRILQKID